MTNKPITFADQVRIIKDLLDQRAEDYNDVHGYTTRQIAKLTAELDDLELYLRKFDAAVRRVLAATSLDEVDIILDDFGIEVDE